MEANGGDINDLRTLEKQPGVRMMSEGSSSERINNQKVYWVMSNEVLSTDNVITLSEVISYRKKKCPDYKYYICSFWLKFSKATSENCEAKIKVVSYPDSEDSVNTQRYKVSEVKLCGQGKEFTLELDTKGRAQFYQETQSPDGGVHIYGEVYFNKDADGTAFSGICQYTEAVKGGTKSCTSTYVDYKGKIRRERDEYKTETVYEYDADGVLCKKIIQHPKTTEKLIYEITTAAEKTTETSAVSQTETCYDFFGNVTQVKYNGNAETALNMLTTTYHYDNSKGRLDGVENDAGIENDVGGQNSLKYDENGRLWKVFPTEDSTG